MGGAAVTSIRALRATDNAPTIFFAFAVGGRRWLAAVRLRAVATAAGAAGSPRSASAVVAFLAQLLMTEAYGALAGPEAALWQQLTPIASYLWALTIGERIGRVDGRRRAARPRGCLLRQPPRSPPAGGDEREGRDGRGDPGGGAVTGRAPGKARARLLLVGSAVSFGLMAVLARLLSARDGGFAAGQLTVIRFVVSNT